MTMVLLLILWEIKQTLVLEKLLTEGDGKGLPKSITVEGRNYNYNASLSKEKGCPYVHQ